MNRPQIVEIRRRSTQGATQPFLCQADDDNMYWVKGAKAGNEALIAEWVAARLGRLLNLPIPDIAQVTVSDKLVDTSAVTGIAELGVGIRFGSLHVNGAQEYDMTHLEHTGETLRWSILAFDAWVRNTDRTFSRPFGSSGNPNLLWCTLGKQLYVIDHNNAFLPDDLFEPSNFTSHVFANERGRFTSEFKQDILTRMAEALRQLNDIVEELPPEWQNVDIDCPVSGRLTSSYLSAILSAPIENPLGYWALIGGTP